MKWLIYLFILFTPLLATAQATKGPTDAYRIYQCERYIVEQIAKKQHGLLDTFSRQIVTPTTKTIYVVKTSYIRNLPDTVNGYHIRLVDVDSMAKTMYRELKDESSVLLYLTDGLNLYEQYTIWVMPVSLEKKGRRYLRKYELTPSCKVIFNYTSGTGLFSLTNVEYL